MKFSQEVKDYIFRNGESKKTTLQEQPASGSSEVPKDLEEAARYYLLNEHSSPLNAVFHQADPKSEMVYHKDIENAFIAGAKWQKEQMMKEAVEGCVTMYANKIYPTLIGIRERIGDTGDKVKIIIVKED